MLETQVIVYKYDGKEHRRIVISRVSVTRKIRVKIVQADGIEVTDFECDGYELLAAIRAVL